MNFLLEQPKIDLGNTLIENIFITDFMPLADGTYVKVYLLGYKYACDNESSNKFNNETIAKHLKIPLSDVLNAWNYWEKEGLIKRHNASDKYNFQVEFVNLKQLYIDNIYKHISKTNDSYYTTADELISLNKNTSIRKMFDEIENLFGRPVNPNDKRKIIDWLKKYKLKPDVMLQAFTYCIKNKNITTFSYIEKVAASWHDAGVTDMDSLSAYLETKNDRFHVYSRISKALGFNYRSLTENEMKTIDRWIDEWKFTMDMILKALENSTKISNPNINYFNSILENWFKKGFKKTNEIKETKPIKKQFAKKSKTSNNKFHNFEQRTKNYSPEELDKIGRRNFEKKIKELGLDS